MKNLPGLLLKIVISVGLFWWILHKTDLREVAAQWRAADLMWLAAALLVQGLNLGIGFFRWFILLRAQNIMLSPSQTGVIGMISHFFSTFSVGMVGGDLARVFYTIRHHPENKSAAVVSIVADRIFGLFGLCLVALVVMPMSWSLLTADPRTAAFAWLIVLMVLGVLPVFALLALSETPGPWQALLAWRSLLPFAKQREELGRILSAYVRNWPVALQCLGLSVCIHLLVILMGYCLILGLRIPFSLIFTAGMTPIVNVAISIPVTISGFGVREGVLLLFFQSQGLGAGSMMAYSLSTVVLALFYGLIGGIFYIFHRVPKREMAAVVGA